MHHRTLSALLIAAATVARAASLVAPLTPGAWHPQEGAPAAVQAADDALRFASPAGRAVPRACWDLEGRWDLRRQTHVELVVRATNLTALASLTLHLQSGNGWYAGSAFLNESGTRRLILPLGAFTSEGSPAGWGDVRVARLSLWRRTGARDDAAVDLLGLRSGTAALAVVRGTQSVPAGEQSAAGAIAARTSGWLGELGLGHALLDEVEVVDRGLDDFQLVILPYNPRPLPRLLNAWLAASRHGTRFIVHYSASPEWANQLGFRLGAYRETAEPGRWAAIRFPRPLPGAPDLVFQDSRTLYTAAPADTDSRILAVWEDAAGAPQPEPAWLVSPRGWWMTHVWQEEDAARKQRILLGMVGEAVPDAWTHAAEQALWRAGRVEPFGDWPAVTNALAARAAAAPHPDTARTALAAAAARYAALPGDLRARRFAEVVDGEAEVRRQLAAAWAATMPPSPAFPLGAWEPTGLGGARGQWPAALGALAAAGARCVFPYVLSPTELRVPDLDRPPTAAEAATDPLAACLREAHARGIEVHAWVFATFLGDARPAAFARLQAAGRLQRTSAGLALPFLSPADPENAAQITDLCTKLVRRYAVDGLQLDYIRFAQEDAGFEPVARAAFERTLGRHAASWPGAVLAGGSDHAAFRRWRATCVQDLVRQVARQVRTARPGVRLSAAVYPNVDAARALGQDWPAWMAHNDVDFVCPMTYTANLGLFRRQVAAALAAAGAPARVRPGIGVGADACQLRPDQVLAQLDAARQAGAGGAVLFPLNAVTQRDLLPLLGVMRP